MEKIHILTKKELAEFLKCSTKTIDRMMKCDIIPFYNVMSDYRFDLQKVLIALEYIPMHLQEKLKDDG